jgi:hypothetical protein
MLFTLAIVLIAMWLLAIGLFHITGIFVHGLLVLAMIAFALHLRDKARLGTMRMSPRPRR